MYLVMCRIILISSLLLLKEKLVKGPRRKEGIEYLVKWKLVARKTIHFFHMTK